MLKVPRGFEGYAPKIAEWFTIHRGAKPSDFVEDIIVSLLDDFEDLQARMISLESRLERIDEDNDS